MSGDRNCALASSKFSLRTQATYSGANFIALTWPSGTSVEADQIGHELIGAGGPGGKLPPQPEPDIDPAALSVARFDQCSRFRAPIVCERIGQPDEIDVARIAVAEEIQPALLDPTRPGISTDPVRLGENPILRLEDLHRRVLVGDAI